MTRTDPMRTTVLACLFLLAALPAAAQTAAAKRGAASITEADVRKRIFLIADDSMGGRDTPSPGLDKTAAYIAAEFKRFGLVPGGDSGSFLQRYPITRTRLDTLRSGVSFEGEGALIALGFARDAATQSGATMSGTWPILLVGGPMDSTSVTEGMFKGKAIIWVAPNGPLTGQFQTMRRLARGQPAAVFVSVTADSLFSALLAQQQQTRLTAGWAQSSTAPTVMIRESAVITQVPQAGEQLEMVRGAPKFMAVEVPDWQARLTLTRETLEEQRAPNVVGILPGSDPVLKNEYVVYSAHMDHVGTRSPRPGTAPSNGAPVDSIWNGADDDASGTVGVIELAEAFSRPGVRPKRSVVFLTVSGEEKGLWGSDYFGTKPPMPITSIVANLNADMIGRNWKDTIVVIGKEHSDLGATLASVTAKHPELRMAAIDDLWPEQNFYQRSDHYHFARRGVPVLFFFSGTHPDYHQASDTPDKIDAEKLARIAQLMYWTGLTVANAAERPKWNPESYTKYVK